ncbi:MAG: hypothetical protein KGD63_08260 [Candidatus Lokiarchaeota archaeon]|nr:hypothetical protein [Candidatus Lokiarchaeota archaeon]
MLEVISQIILTIMSILAVLLIEFASKKGKRNISLSFISIAVLFFGLFNSANALATIFENEYFARIAGMSMFPCVLFLMIGINYTMKQSYYSNSLIIIIALGSLLIYIGMQPDAVQFSLDNNRLMWSGSFMIGTALFNFINPISLFYWGLKTWRNASFSVKRIAFYFFLGHIIFALGAIVFFTLYFIEPLFIIPADITLIIGLSLILYAITKEPRILHILPFKIYRIIIKDRNGNLLFNYNWSEYNISENLFTGFLNAVQLMSEEVMNIGGLLNIELQEGILILNESEYITVGLVASNSSKSLRNSIIQFTKDFEGQFKRLLKKSCISMNEYETAYELIRIYFSNFSTRFITNRESVLYLPGKKIKQLKEIDNKLKNIFQNKEEYELIKNDLVKAPINFTTEFLELYDELKDESEELIGKMNQK